VGNFKAEKEQSLNLLSKVLKKHSAPDPPLSAVPQPAKTKKSKKRSESDNIKNGKKRKKFVSDGDVEINVEKSVNKIKMGGGGTNKGAKGKRGGKGGGAGGKSRGKHKGPKRVKRNK